MPTQMCVQSSWIRVQLPQSNNLCPSRQRGEEGHFHKFPAFRQTEGEQSLFFCCCCFSLPSIQNNPQAKVFWGWYILQLFSSNSLGSSFSKQDTLPGTVKDVVSSDVKGTNAHFLQSSLQISNLPFCVPLPDSQVSQGLTCSSSASTQAIVTQLCKADFPY